MNKILRITIICVAAIVVLVICSFIATLLNVDKFVLTPIICAAIAFLAGRYLNIFLKKKYPESNQNKGN